MSFFKKVSDWLSTKNARQTILAVNAFALIGSVFGSLAVTSSLSNAITRGDALSSTMVTLKEVFTVPVQAVNGAALSVNPAVLEFGLAAGIVGGLAVGASKLLEARKEHQKRMEKEQSYSISYGM